MTNTEIRKMDCTAKSLVLVRGSQARCVLQNSTASRLTVQFALTSFLPDGEDLHIFCTPEDTEKVAGVVKQMGGDFSKATLITMRG
jgi:hypothetical protein